MFKKNCFVVVWDCKGKRSFIISKFSAGNF